MVLTHPQLNANQENLFQIQGVIDTWILHEGYSIFFDWKSNWLGPHMSSYSAAAMIDNAMEHRYDLQARIYQKAISTYLNSHEAISVQSGIYVYLRALEAIEWNYQQNQFVAINPYHSKPI